MRDDNLHLIKSYCHAQGFKIYPKPINNYQYILVVAKRSNIKWFDIPVNKRKEYEFLDGCIWQIKTGKELFKINPSAKEPKYFTKINELYREVYNNHFRILDNLPNLKRNENNKTTKKQKIHAASENKRNVQIQLF